MNEEDFLEQCAFILGVNHEYRERTPVPKMPDREGNIRNTYKGRYNGRIPGNGRFPGSGIIRSFGCYIQVRLTTPPLHGNYSNFDDALLAIIGAMRLYMEQVALKIAEEQLKALADNPVGYRTATDEEIDISRRQLVRGNQIAGALVKARLLTAEERVEMEAATISAHVEIDALLAEKTKTTTPYHERRKVKAVCPRCGDPMIDGRCVHELCGYLA